MEANFLDKKTPKKYHLIRSKGKLNEEEKLSE